MTLTPPDRRSRARLAAGALAVFLLGMPGCSRVFAPAGIRFHSIDRDTLLAPAVAASGYRSPDSSSAEFFLSDIPLQDLSRAESFDELAGTIVRVHLFIRPKPGKTPIEPTASTATVQAVVLARGEIGLYGGGAFVLPSGTPGDDTLRASVRGGSVRLMSATAGFVDQLGAASLSAGVSAPLDEAAAGIMAHLFDEASRLTHTLPEAHAQAGRAHHASTTDSAE
ncbi:MAG: hypothetical protein K8E66_02740 [Phycisphaerales bacterium]|nr:hypothetical protein [Phycisphaerales bacterium]